MRSFLLISDRKTRCWEWIRTWKNAFTWVLSRRTHAVRGGVNHALWAEQFWNSHPQKYDREIFEDCPPRKLDPSKTSRYTVLYHSCSVCNRIYVHLKLTCTTITKKPHPPALTDQEALNLLLSEDHILATLHAKGSVWTVVEHGLLLSLALILPAWCICVVSVLVCLTSHTKLY